MRCSQSVEWAGCVLALLSVNNGSMTNEELNTRLMVSSSYLKKVTRKLVVYGLIVSSYGKNGGFKLAKSADCISMYDIFNAIEGNGLFFIPSGLMEKVFPGQLKKVNESKSILEKVFRKAQDRWSKEMQGVSLRQIIEDKVFYNDKKI
jgi:Rrf2 family protein